MNNGEIDSNNELDRDILKYENDLAHRGYADRDRQIPSQFSSMLQAFSILLTLVTAAKIFLGFSVVVSILVNISLGIVGFLALGTFLVDMQANISCKKALRTRSDAIEKKLSITYWDTIVKRDKYFEERLVKDISHYSGAEQTSAGGFVLAGRFLIGVWIVYAFVLIFFLEQQISLAP